MEQTIHPLHRRQQLSAQGLLGVHQKPPLHRRKARLVQEVLDLAMEAREFLVGSAEDGQGIDVHFLRVVPQVEDEGVGGAHGPVARDEDLPGELRQVRILLHPDGRLPHFLDGGNEQPDQDGDDRDHHQQLDEGEA